MLVVGWKLNVMTREDAGTGKNPLMYRVNLRLLRNTGHVLQERS